MPLLISHTIFYPVICFLFLGALWHGERSPICSRLTDLNRRWRAREKKHPTLAMVKATGLQPKAAVPCSCPWRSAERGHSHHSLEVKSLPQPPAPLGWREWDASRHLCRVLSSTPAVRNAFQAQVKQQGVLGSVKSIGQTSGLGLWNNISEENILVLLFGLLGK